MNAAYKRAADAAASVGAGFDFVSYWGEGEFRATAPTGKVWASSGVHELVSTYEDGMTADEALADIVDRMSPGASDCQEVSCDWCREAPQEDR